jgi:hypothetical protein
MSIKSIRNSKNVLHQGSAGRVFAPAQPVLTFTSGPEGDPAPIVPEPAPLPSGPEGDPSRPGDSI